jgi:hypothetical protein
MNTEITRVPDLLRRFVDTPHIARFQVGSTRARLETNDLILAATIQAATAGCETEGAGELWYWKLIIDEQAPRGGREVIVLSAGPIGTMIVGLGTVIAVDRERREVLGFVAPDILGEEFVAIVLPRILKLLQRPENTQHH